MFGDSESFTQQSAAVTAPDTEILSVLVSRPSEETKSQSDHMIK